MTAKRINLLPSELRDRRKSRATAAGMIAAGMLVVAALAAFYLAQVFSLNSHRSNLERQEEANASLTAQIAELREFGQLESELRQKTILLDDLAEFEVRWSVLLADVSLVIPPDVWLTGLSATVTQSTGSEDTPSTVLGSIQLAGSTFSHPDVAKWLARLDDISAFTFPYLSLSSRDAVGAQSLVNFDSSVQLSEDAFRNNQRGARRRL